MANASQKKELQSAHATNAIGYGQVGTATYHGDRKRWTFLRNLASDKKLAFPLRRVAGRTVDKRLPEESGLSGDEPGPQGDPITKCSGVIYDLFGNKQEALISCAITDSIHTHDPDSSDCVAFGSASSRIANDIHVGHEAIPVVATVGGAAGEAVRMVRISAESVELSDRHGRDIRVRMPQVSHTNESWWKGAGEPIRQICFAPISDHSGTWMAVRQSSSTILFQPLLHGQFDPVDVATTKRESRFTSLLEIKPVLTLPISRTGGYAHADISFHPQDCNQIAIVDQHGNWSIWRSDGGCALGGWPPVKIHLSQSGKLYSWTGEKRPARLAPYHDGWHRIVWVENSRGEVTRLLVCNRRTAAIYEIETGELVGMLDLSLGPSRDAQWILDVKKSEAASCHAYILTSARLFWITMASADRRDVTKEDPYTIICSWRHFRSRDDLTARLTVLEMIQCKL